ncbi:MAG: hypothetical protein N3H84_02765 [Candidatus Caldarchaeum sp.]|nr:hypothetical protein [Candidatus Caldarchaeum sp.]
MNDFLLFFLPVVAGAAVTYVMLPVSMWLSRRTGAVGLDVHKPSPYPVPKLGGLALVFGGSAGMIVFWVFTGKFFFTSLFLSSFIAAVIGLVEDFREINPVVKPLLLTFAGVPVVVAGVYSPNPVLPFVGATRLTILYPLLVLIAFAVVCNAVNSVDVLNGSMALTSLASLLPLTIVSYLESKPEVFMVCLVSAAVLTVFLTKNFYPAKTFAGNVGSLYMGALITFVAVYGRMEVVAIVALMPQIMNEFHIIYSLRGLRSGKAAAVRPTIVSSSLIGANPDKRAPITLLRLVTAGKRLTEKEAVSRLTILCLYSSFLSLFTYFVLIRGLRF